MGRNLRSKIFGATHIKCFWLSCTFLDDYSVILYILETLCTAVSYIFCLFCEILDVAVFRNFKCIANLSATSFFSKAITNFMIVYKTQNSFYNSNIVINKFPGQLLRFRNIFVVRKSVIIRIVNIWIVQETSVLKTER